MQEAFWFIGTAEDALKQTPSISEEYKKTLQRYLKRTRAKQTSVPKCLENCNADLNTFLNRRDFWLGLDIETLDEETKAQRNEELSICETNIGILQYRKRQLETECKSLPKQLENYTKRAEKWKDFLDRNVKDEYPRKSVEPYGRVIVVEGRERGGFWDLAEFNEREKWRAEEL